RTRRRAPARSARPAATRRRPDGRRQRAEPRGARLLRSARLRSRRPIAPRRRRSAIPDTPHAAAKRPPTQATRHPDWAEPRDPFAPHVARLGLTGAAARIILLPTEAPHRSHSATSGTLPNMDATDPTDFQLRLAAMEDLPALRDVYRRSSLSNERDRRS